MGILNQEERIKLTVNIILPKDDMPEYQIRKLNILMDQIDLSRRDDTDRKYKLLLKNGKNNESVIVYKTMITIYSNEIFVLSGFITGLNHAKHLPDPNESLKRFSTTEIQNGVNNIENHHLGVEW